MSLVKIAKRLQYSSVGSCPECERFVLVIDKTSGEVACRHCGLVITDHLVDHRPEWRAFTIAEHKAKVRVGAPTSLRRFDKGLSTNFHPFKDFHGKTLPMKERLKMLRLRKWNIRARMHSSVERNLSQAMTELRLLSNTLHLPSNVEENAALIYRKALDRDLVKGRSIHAIVAASLHAACRLTRTARSLAEIVDASPRNRKEISRCYRLIQRELDLAMPIDDPIKFVTKIASKVGLDQKTQNRAVELLQNNKETKSDIGKGPPGLAAAALYIAAIMNGTKVTQKALAKAAGVTEVTVRNRYKGLDHVLNLGLRRTNVRRNFTE